MKEGKIPCAQTHVKSAKHLAFMRTFGVPCDRAYLKCRDTSSSWFG